MARLNKLSDQGYWNLFYQTAPTSVVGAPGDGQVTLSWTAPGATYAPPTLDYIVQYSSDSGSTWTQFTDSVSTGTSTTVTGLTDGTSYVFRVAATNGLGQGAWSATSASVRPGGDPYFSSVALLLHFDGTGTSITDNSNYATAITAVGNATQSTIQSKWGGKSLSLDGTNSNLSLASTNLSFAGDFVIEAWVYLTSLINYSTLLEARQTASFQNFICGIYNISGTYRLDFVTGGGSGARLTGTSTSVPLNTWTHVALVRSNGVLAAYVNGARDATTINYSAAINPTSATALIGRNVDGTFFPGYIDDFRVTVGSRGYTGSTITVPTAAFPNS